MSTSPNIKDYSTLILLSLIWSSSFIAIEFAIETASPVIVAFGRTLLASIILILIVIKRKKRLPKDLKTWKIFFWAGLVGASIPFMLFSWAQLYLDSGTAGILMAFTPLTTLFLASIFTDDEKITQKKTIGVMIGLFGVFILLGGIHIGFNEFGYLPPLAIILATIGYAISTILLKKTTHLSSVVSSSGLMIMGNISLIPFLVWQWDILNFNVSLKSLIAISFLGIFPTAMGVVLMVQLIHRTSASFMSLQNYIVPGLAILWGIIFLDESFSLNILFGFLLIILGVAIASSKASLSIFFNKT